MRGEVPGLSFWDTPQGARPTGSYDEFGNPVYQDVAGNQFTVGQQPQQPQGEGLSFGNVMNALATPFRMAMGRGTEQDTAAVQGVGNALAQGLTAPGRALRGEPVTYGDAFATALDYGLLGVPMTAPEGALRANSFRAYHGSPHTFDRFSMDRIGTGEGAQAYGHGLYFAENEGVARGYRDALANPVRSAGGSYSPTGFLDFSAFAMSRQGNDFAQFTDYIRSAEPWRTDEQISAAWEKAQQGYGSLYEVQINADPNTFLDWDAPLSAQDPLVQDGINRVARSVESPISRVRDTMRGNDLKPLLQSPQMVEELNNYFPGIRYLDAGSRAAGDGSRNFVVFDDSLIQILRRYGIGAAAIGGGWSVSPEEYDSVLGGA
jgi:hypothetical protein